eukprot:gb/GFBE01043092.1/.p1 GENE.gb/GFBE01043092.1/~~gb/GFBE01043092.1/.p1  ORF type:complete len:486 (+),score=86.20 gb/GFBE01043092.1/:1-1458(+)
MQAATASSDKPQTWFEEIFGFAEGSFEATRRKFQSSGETLSSLANGRTFHVGPFELVSAQELKAQLAEATARAADCYWSAGDLRFENLAAESWQQLHEQELAEGAVFQVSSLFNCLETHNGRIPEDGITIYSKDATQGAACALSCPAAAVFRNYFAGPGGAGQSGERQLDCMSLIGDLLQNQKQEHWTMRNGYCLPKVAGRVADLSSRIAGNGELEGQVRSRVQVGVHWDTEVASGSHRVCQVHCSALPVACVKSARQSDWLGFAAPILQGAFDAVLAAAATLAARRSARVRVYLTALGLEPLGNRREWIADAIDRALQMHEREPLDVVLVHSPGAMPGPQDPFAKLENGRRRPATPPKGELLTEFEPQELLPSPGSGGGAEAAGLLRRNKTAFGDSFVTEQLSELFSCFDENGDGLIDRREFMDVLRLADESYFTPQRVKLLMAEADKDQKGSINYREFLAWVFHEDSDVLSRIAKLPPTVQLH